MKKENIEWFKKFVTICKKNKIWYQVFYGTLIGTIREKGPISWDYDFDVIMTPDSYKKLKSLYPEYCLDSISNNKYPWLLPKFIPNTTKIENSTLFVDIYLLVNSSDKKIKKYTSIKTKIIYSIQVSRSKWKPKVFTLAWFIKYITFPFWFIKSKFTTTEALNLLEVSKDTNTNFIINSPFAVKKGTLFVDTSFETVKKDFLDFKVNVPKDYDKILRQRYSDYMIPIEEKKEHIETLFVD